MKVVVGGPNGNKSSLTRLPDAKPLPETMMVTVR